MKQIFRTFLAVVLVSVVFLACDSGRGSDSGKIKRYTITFKVNGVEKNFKTEIGGLENDEGEWNTVWFLTPDNYEDTDTFSITFWDIPVSGDVFQTQTYDDDYIEMSYNDDAGEFFFAHEGTGSGTLTFTEWEGPGGWARGTFAGTFSSGSDDVEITDGSFEILIDK